MKLFYLVGIIVVVATGVASHTKAAATAKKECDLTKFLKHLEVIPDLFSDEPCTFLKVSYPSGVFADKGVELKPAQVVEQPNVEWKANKNAFYTLVFTDPDAPSRAEPKMREFHHWLVGNIPGNDIAAGQTLSEFVGSAPPKDSGLHRYVFMVYKQPGKLEFDEPHIPNTEFKNRPKFSTKEFAAKYKLGAPVAVNFYQAQYDDSVPKLEEQLGIKA